MVQITTSFLTQARRKLKRVIGLLFWRPDHLVPDYLLNSAYCLLAKQCLAPAGLYGGFMSVFYYQSRIVPILRGSRDPPSAGKLRPRPQLPLFTAPCANFLPPTATDDLFLLSPVFRLFPTHFSSGSICGKGVRRHQSRLKKPVYH